ncbi:MAG TPA: hypothetical protein VHZ25_16675 [Acidobacteriaceae bacterium]|jgi:hypothetical protein|nr:hypothetical protein [Acidobacteriaceae bacterium]
MVANCDRHCPLARRMLIAASALAVGFSLSAAAQSAPAADHSADGQSFSSSTDYQAYLSTDSLLGGSSLAPAALASASPQYGGGGGRSSSYPSYEGRMSHIAFEGGAGFTAPIGNDTHFSSTDLDNGYLSPSVAWGYNVNVGGGWNFTKRIGALLEYSFYRQSMAGDYLDAFNADCGSACSSSGLGGNINTWSLTVDPIIYLPFSHKSGAYVTGGGGFYRKVTNFTEAVPECSFYYGCVNVAATVDHFSSNQGGLNIGLGIYRKIFGQDSNAKFYAEARYVWVNSPVASSSNSFQGEGTEGLIPVTFGIRF